MTAFIFATDEHGWTRMEKKKCGSGSIPVAQASGVAPETV
jgi:hypothetical protein